MGFYQEWVRLRQQDGFKSARDFYIKSGAQKVLRFTYVNYWKIEKGEFLPKPDSLNLMVACLRRLPAPKDLERLLHAYLRDYLGSEAAYEWIMGIVSKKSNSQGSSPYQHAATAYLQRDIHHLSLEEHEAVHKSFASYWIWHVLSDDKKEWDASGLAKLLNIGLKETLAGAKILAAQKLIQIKPKNRLRCPLAGKHFFFYPKKTLEKNYPGARYQAEMAERGDLLRRDFMILRADESDFQGYFAHLKEAISASSVYSTRENSPSSALFLVQGFIHRLLKY